jgi:RES domain-containing protein
MSDRRATSPEGGLKLFCHVPGDVPIDLDRLAQAGDASDRWNGPGEPTVYLASDPGVALAEYARHHAPDGSATVDRLVLRVALTDVRLVDLRRDAVRRSYGVADGPAAFLDKDVARRVASTVRGDGEAHGLIVPSMAFLDDLERGDVVLFGECLPGGLRACVRSFEVVGRLRLSPAQGDGLPAASASSPRTIGG